LRLTAKSDPGLESTAVDLTCRMLTVLVVRLRRHCSKKRSVADETVLSQCCQACPMFMRAPSRGFRWLQPPRNQGRYIRWQVLGGRRSRDQHTLLVSTAEPMELMSQRLGGGIVPIVLRDTRNCLCRGKQARGSVKWSCNRCNLIGDIAIAMKVN
jgi:hypothetical protein